MLPRRARTDRAGRGGRSATRTTVAEQRDGPSNGAVRDSKQVLPVLALGQLLPQGVQLIAADPSGREGDLFRAGDAEALAFLQRAHKLGGLDQTVGRPGVKPSKPATHELDLQLPAFPIDLVDACNLQLAPGGRLQAGCDFDDLPVIEVIEVEAS